MLAHYLEALIPVFVAVNVFGIMPIFVGLTGGMGEGEKRLIVRQGALTALAVGLGFILIGKGIFSLLSITVGDFKVAGGLLLLVFAVTDLIFAPTTRTVAGPTIGVVPLGVPLITGPAVLTTLLILVDHYGYWPTIISLMLNLAIVWVAFNRSAELTRFLGPAGSQGLGKVMHLLLAAIGVMMVRRGIAEMLLKP